MESRLVYGTQELVLSGAVFTIGRSDNCNLQIYSRAVSRMQCYLIRRYQEGAEYFQILDGDIHGQPSKNGTYLNGKRLGGIPVALRNGDEISFASTRLFYQLPICNSSNDDTLSKATLETPV